MTPDTDSIEQIARWTLLISTTVVLFAVAGAVVVGKVGYSVSGITATAFYVEARLARVST